MEDGTSQSAYVHDFLMIYAVCLKLSEAVDLCARFYCLSAHLLALLFPRIQQILTWSFELSTMCIQ